MKRIKRYFYTLFIALSILINAIFGGYSYEPLSSTAWRRSKKGKPFLANVIDLFLGKDHCTMAHIEFLLAQKGRESND